MQKFKLPNDKGLIPINNTKLYSSKILKTIKHELCRTKSKLDKCFKKKHFSLQWRAFDPFRLDKSVVANIACTFNVTNAWLKCYEIIHEFDLIPIKLSTDKFVHFDNAAFPGSFIISTHHYIATQRTWLDSYEWHANSLIHANESNTRPLEDKYELYKNYPEKWFMSDTNNGDVLSRENQIYFRSVIGPTKNTTDNRGVDLYTSDLGFDVSFNYNNQELLHAKTNMGQMISGILTLRKGGSFVTKQYTALEMITVSLMYGLSQLFDEFYVCKPFTSREANSEMYLVGKGFIGGVSIDHPYIQAMFDRINGTVPFKTPMFLDVYVKGYLRSIINMNKIICASQIHKINIDIDRCKKCNEASYKGRHCDNPIAISYRDEIEPIVLKWYTNMNITPIQKKDMLNMVDIYKQG